VSATRDAYLGWTTPRHTDGCTGRWDVTVRTASDRRRRTGGRPHDCPQAGDHCGHSDRYDQLTVRLVCGGCSAVHLITGEERSTMSTMTAATGYGLPALRRSGLWLWPGPPWIHGGAPRPMSDPQGYLITTGPARPAELADVVGEIGQGRGPRGGTRVWAAAVPDDTGRYGRTYTQTRDGLTSLGAAARWAAAQLATAGGGSDG
jgi:hypothetical protein